MGDGRYYTYTQFYDIVFITVLSMLAAGGIVYGYLRRARKAGTEYCCVMFAFIAVYAILKMIETVIPGITAARMLRNTESAIIILTLVHLAVMKKVYKNIRLLWTFFALAAAAFAAAPFGLFVSDYAFHCVRYSGAYKVILAVLLIAACLWSVISCTANKRGGIFSGSTKFGIINSFLLPGLMLSYAALAAYNSRYIDYCEFLLLYYITAVAFIDFNVGTESGLTMMAFDKIGDMSKSFIFVIDGNGIITYKNKAARETDFFTSSKTVDLNNIAGIFAGERVYEASRLGKAYIISELTGRKNYFTYKSTVLEDEDNEIGHIITINVITELMELLNSLEDKKRKSEAANEKLKNYSQIVYYLEKEKEINFLLNKIITSRDEQMRQLSRLIRETKSKIGDADFEEHVDAAIARSNMVLEEVRNTVTAYREYYGG